MLRSCQLTVTTPPNRGTFSMIARTSFPASLAERLRWDGKNNAVSITCNGSSSRRVALSGLKEIGRASGRERGEISVGAVSLKKKKKQDDHTGKPIRTQASEIPDRNAGVLLRTRPENLIAVSRVHQGG